MTSSCILFSVYTWEAIHRVLAHLLYRSKSGFVCAQFVSCNGIILGMGSAIERRHYNVMSSLTGYTDIQTDCCSVYWLSIPPQYSDCLVRLEDCIYWIGGGGCASYVEYICLGDDRDKLAWICFTHWVHNSGELWEDLERKLPPLGHPQSGIIR